MYDGYIISFEQRILTNSSFFEIFGRSSVPGITERKSPISISLWQIGHCGFSEILIK